MIGVEGVAAVVANTIALLAVVVVAVEAVDPSGQLSCEAECNTARVSMQFTPSFLFMVSSI